MSVAQTEIRVPGAVTTVAVGTVVVGPLDRDVAVDGEDGAAQITEEAGGAAAVGTGDAGAAVPPFFRPARPVWWAVAAS